MALASTATTKISDLNADCFGHLLKFLCSRDITALSVATCLWLKDAPLVYEDIKDFEIEDIMAFMKECGTHLRSFIIAKPNHGDIEIYRILKILTHFCTNMESIDVVFSHKNREVEWCISALNKFKNLQNLALSGAILSPNAVRYLSNFKCLPTLKTLKIACSLNFPVCLDKCLERCQSLKILHLRIWALLKPESLQHCKNLEELQIVETEWEKLKRRHAEVIRNENIRRMIYQTHEVVCSWRWTIFETLRNLPKIQKLHLESVRCFCAADMQAIAQLPALKHLELQNFIFLKVNGPWNLESTLPAGSLAHLEEAHFVNIVGYSFESVLMYLVCKCLKIKLIRLREMNLLSARSLVEVITVLTRRTEQGIKALGPPKLHIVVEDFGHYGCYILKNRRYYRLTRNGYIDIKFVKIMPNTIFQM